MTFLLTFVFVLSGGAGLIYESIWSRYLGLFVGHSAYAQVIVLVIFLGGMSIGAAVAARRSARLDEPLLWYALIEVVVGLLGLVFHDAFRLASAIAYDAIFPALADGPVLIAVKWLLAALLILPQSALLGATFPLMSAGLLRRLRSEHPDAAIPSGRILGLLYFANSLGASVGVLVAGFWLIRAVGLPGTLAVAATLNILVAAITYVALRAARTGAAETSQSTVDVFDRLGPQASRSSQPSPSPDGSSVAADERLWRLLLSVSFGTAVASFIYEIAWIRMLSLVLGSATHAFELMLSAFILGLALGAFWIRGRADRIADPMRGMGMAQFAMGVLAIGTLGLYTQSFHWMASLIQAVDDNAAGYGLFNFARYGIALAVMLPPTFCAGVMLPLITHTLLGARHGERAIGAVYAWNTVGSIIGVTLGALWLMPVVGLRSMLIIGGAIDIALGVWLLWHCVTAAPQTRLHARWATALGTVIVLGALATPAFDPGILSSGVFRYGAVPERGSRTIRFYKDGRTASVSAWLASDSGFSLATNGKPDASISRTWFDAPLVDSLRPSLKRDESTQVLLPLITLAHAPRATQAAVIGHGSGISSHLLLGSPTLESLVTIDIEPEMIEASRLFRPANARVFDDPRSRFVHDDARSFFAASHRRFDLILSEPSNPWVSGVSGLFTEEFYERVSRYLTPDGVFGQWLHLYEINDNLVLGVLASLHRRFRSYSIYLTNEVDVLVVASNAPQIRPPDWSVFSLPKIADDLRHFRPLTAESLVGTLLATRTELAPLLDSISGTNSDYYPTLDLGAERERFLRHAATGFMGMSRDRFDVAAALDARTVPLASVRNAALSHHRLAAQALAARLRRGEVLPSNDTVAANRELQQARFRGEQLRQSMAAGRPPADWFTWFTTMIAVEEDRHGGTMGTVDSAWYAAVERFMIAQHAPADGLSALRFLRAAVTYDWPTAARETPVLITAWDERRRWLPSGIFLDAALLSRLRVGDVRGARTIFDLLLRDSGRSTDDVRVQLLDAHISAAEAALEY